MAAPTECSIRLFRAIPLPGERSLVARSCGAAPFSPSGRHGADEFVKCRPLARGAPPRPSLDLVLRCVDELSAACFSVVVEGD